MDLAAERRNGDFVRDLILSRIVTAVHDLSDGGLGVGLAEMALAGEVGATIDSLPSGPEHAVLFGEDQARYLVVAPPERAQSIELEAKARGIVLMTLGSTGGDALNLPKEAPILLAELRKAHENPLPEYMAGNDRAFYDKG